MATQSGPRGVVPAQRAEIAEHAMPVGDGVSGGPVVRQRTVDRRIWVPTLGPGMVLGALGAIGMIFSLFLPWRSGSVYPSDIPLAFLFDHTTTATSPSL